MLLNPYVTSRFVVGNMPNPRCLKRSISSTKYDAYLFLWYVNIISAHIDI